MLGGDSVTIKAKELLLNGKISKYQNNILTITFTDKTNFWYTAMGIDEGIDGKELSSKKLDTPIIVQFKVSKDGTRITKLTVNLISQDTTKLIELNVGDELVLTGGGL